MRREAKMSTGISKGIAVPHATVEGLETIAGVLGISGRGIDYDALDGHPVYLVFMVLTPPKDAELHLQTLQNLASLIENREFSSRLAAAASPAEAFAVIKDFERDATM
jgi:PTS system fructose-specific IIC component/PTS system nitrogen regulatory IIA component